MGFCSVFLKGSDKMVKRSSGVILAICDHSCKKWIKKCLNPSIDQTSADSTVRILSGFTVRCSVHQNLKFSVGRVFECLDFESELDFDRQTPHSEPGQNPDSAVRRRLLSILKNGPVAPGAKKLFKI